MSINSQNIVDFKVMLGVMIWVSRIRLANRYSRHTVTLPIWHPGTATKAFSKLIGNEGICA